MTRENRQRERRELRVSVSVGLGLLNEQQTNLYFSDSHCGAVSLSLLMLGRLYRGRESPSPAISQPSLSTWLNALYLTNQRPVSRSGDLSRPIRGQATSQHLVECTGSQILYALEPISFLPRQGPWRRIGSVLSRRLESPLK